MAGTTVGIATTPRSTASPPCLRARLISLREIGARDLAAWEDLADHAAERNPFYEPDCLMPAARHLSFGHEISLLVAESDGRFLAAMPVRAVNRWKFPYP